LRLLLDTHALIWWFLDEPNLSLAARTAIAAAGDPVYVSAVSAYEISNKVRLGRLPQAAALDAAFEDFVIAQRFEPLPIALRHAREAGALGIAHRDPFDRLLIAQSRLEDLVLVSNEAVFDGFGVRRLW